jgi:predicted DNA-binding protein/antitoxin component of MazEF toxin-antitoxin module
MATKLTVIVPDELHRRARAVAALKGENISGVVREALAEYVTDAMTEADDARMAEEVRRRIDRGKEKVYSHEEVWASDSDGENLVLAIPVDMLQYLGLAEGSQVAVRLDRERRQLVVAPVLAEAEAIDEEFARQVSDFIERYRPALQALAK